MTFPSTIYREPHPAPSGGLLYGEPGAFSVWEHSHTGRTLHTFDDEYLAQRFAVSIGSRVERAAPLKQSMSADIARCMNDECAVRESCMRWVCRQDGHARVFMRGPLEPHGCRLFVGGGVANRPKSATRGHGHPAGLSNKPRWL